MKRVITIASIVCALSVALPVAQAAKAKKKDKGGTDVFAQFDKNGNGVLDADEKEAIQKAFKAFTGVEHRLEECGTRKGLRCVNDSKATNVDSTLVALRTMPEDRSVLLILGGRPKGGGYKPLRGPVERSVKAVLTIGEAAARVEEDLQGAAPAFPCETLEQAVRVAFQIGQKGETLLLSPACASFDQFRDYEDRGRRFKALLDELGGKPK